MSSDATTSATRRPSVFISYASEDRAAARALRETMTAAGLDVWYDEEELTGGDAWDQKIRRQIRDCEYFMPIISATTEARREGYFRREWRLACERSLDMADDVLFIVPVVIDATVEPGARVPDKFFTVQWLRAPNGNATPALHHLIRRLLAGDHHMAVHPAGVTRAPFQRPQAPFPPPLGSEPPPLQPPDSGAAHTPLPPPMPPFPAVPEKSGFFHGIKFIAEVFWWGLAVTWLLFNRAPRWIRVALTVWLVITLFSFRCSRSGNNDIAGGRKAESEQSIKAAVDELARAAREARRNGDVNDLARVGSEIAQSLGASGAISERTAMGKPLVLTPFARLSSKQPGDDFANAVFAALYGRLTLTHTREVGLIRQAPVNENDAALLARGKALHSGLILAGRLTGETNARMLTVRLLATDDGSTKWTDSFAVGGEEPTAIANKIAENIVPLLPAREQRGGKSESK
jgi:TolB-like protein